MTFLFFFFHEVPDDVFAPDFVWKGSYDYKGQKQPMTLTVTSFNATTGKVNVTLTDSSMEFLLSGESSINHLSSTSSPPPLLSSSHYLCVSLPFILRVPHVNQSITKWSHAWEWKLTIGSKDGCISLRWLTNCPLKSHSSPPLLPRLFSLLLSSFLTASLLLCSFLYCLSLLLSASFSFFLFYHSPAHIMPRRFIHIISPIPSCPLPCRSVQAPGGTVNALAVPDESAGPQLLEQDYWWNLGNGRICEYTQEFEAAGQWSFESNQELWLSFILFNSFIYFLFSLTDKQNITGDGAGTTWEPKISFLWTESSQCFLIIRFFIILLAVPTKKKNHNTWEETVTTSGIVISWLIVCFCLHIFILAIHQMHQALCVNHFSVPALTICWISSDTHLTSKGPGATAEQFLLVELKFLF